MSQKERSSLRTSLGCQRRGATLSMKEGWFLARISLHFLPLSNVLHVHFMEKRKPVSTNPKSYFIKPLQNMKAQIILSIFEDCSNSVSQKGSGDDFGFLGNLRYSAISHQVKKQQCLNGRPYLLDTKRDPFTQGRRSIRVQQILPNPQKG